jgi:hypothetical protein
MGLKHGENETLPLRETWSFDRTCEKAESKSSERTWKAKLKEWKFEKYLTDKQKNIIVAKVGKRRRVGKEITVFNQDLQIIPGTVAKTNRRKGEVVVEVVSPSAGKIPNFSGSLDLDFWLLTVR